MITKDVKVGIYARISRDEDKNYESITTQIDALKRFCRENKLTVIEIFSDDNISGYLFSERPAFNKMLEDLESGRINTVVSKDLSRIGRNNPRTLLFLEQMEKTDKRVILVDEHYDSFKDRDDILPIKSYFNEIYIKDISRKVRSNLKEKQLKGDLLVRATFGYIKEDDKLLKDLQTTPIVQEIFKLYREGYGYRKISGIMNENNYPTPSEVDGTKRSSTTLWNSTHISRILKNEVYIGTHVLRKTIRKGIKTKELNRLPKDEWIRIENHHEPIISKEEFELVQNMINNRNTNKIRAGKDKINLFAGLIFCRCCGSPMFCIKNERFATHYQCGNYFKYGIKACTSHRIMEKRLVVTILLELQRIAKDIEQTLASVDKTLESKAKMQKNFTTHIDKLRKEIDNRKQDKKLMYKDRVKGIIDEEMYLELVGEIDVKLKTLGSQLAEYERLHEESTKSNQVLKSYLDILQEVNEDDLINRELLEKFLVRIEINKDKEIEIIKWNATIESMHQ